MTALEALQDLKEVKGYNNENYYKRLDIIEQELKALEIIKEKRVDIRWCGSLPPLLQHTYYCNR